ncbi:transporter substrate-binding domain-containing protein [Modicisalibacter radicis]|uniref:transporter substrate-binding domain-containing protein n=1 Tax=Halomonas sp. EAR18 TaxID=2518972 RepID=UPI00109CB7A3|nr:transporter substrate-binding domain-containing protein [Halomonas sp. EAR18]
MKKLLLSATLTLAAAGITTVQADDGPLRIGVDVPYAPYQYKLPDGTITGFEVELVAAACQQMQRECRWVEQSWDGIIPALLARKFDLIASSMNITEDRAKQVLFSDPYFQVPSVWVGQAGHDWQPGDGDLADAAIGVQQGTIQDEYVTRFYPKADIRRYGDSGAVVNDMQAKRLDLVFTAFPLAQETLLGDEEFARVGKLVTGPESIYGPGIGAAFRKRDAALAEDFNAAMGEIKADGTFQRLHEKYFGE